MIITYRDTVKLVELVEGEIAKLITKKDRMATTITGPLLNDMDQSEIFADDRRRIEKELDQLQRISDGLNSELDKVAFTFGTNEQPHFVNKFQEKKNE